MGIKSSIFISYTSQKRLWAKWIHNELMAIDFDVEMDTEDWKIGDGLVNKINEALSSHKYFLALWSQDYFSEERWTSHEINAAYNLHKNHQLVIIPFYIEPGLHAPPLYQSLISSNLYDLSESAARQELRLRLEAHTKRNLTSLPSPTRPIHFPGSELSNQSLELHIVSPTKTSLIKMAEEQARKALAPNLPETANEYTLEDIAYQLSILSRSYNFEPASMILENTLKLWNDLNVVEIIASHDPKKLTDILVMKSRAFGLQAYAVMDMGNTRSAYKNALASKLCAEKANHNDLTAWALGTQALILRLDKQYNKALPLVNEGLQLPISGMARSRLLCQAALTWAELKRIDKILSLIDDSEKSIDKQSVSPDDSDGIFFFSRAKHHYYAGNALMRSYFNQAKRAENETKLALKLFSEGDENTKSYSDEMIASIHLAISVSNQGRIDEISEILQPVIIAAPEFRTSWALTWLKRLEMGLKARKFYTDSDIAKSIYSIIQEYELSLT